MKKDLERFIFNSFFLVNSILQQRNYFSLKILKGSSHSGVVINHYYAIFYFIFFGKTLMMLCKNKTNI